jgi:transcriptional regulator with XRE-family HTH domain
MDMDVDTWANRVAAAVRAEMAWQRRSAVDLAKHLDVASGTVSKRLNGEVAIDLVEIEKIAAWLGLTPSELLGRADRGTEQVSA